MRDKVCIHLQVRSLMRFTFLVYKSQWNDYSSPVASTSAPQPRNFQTSNAKSAAKHPLAFPYHHRFTWDMAHTVTHRAMESVEPVTGKSCCRAGMLPEGLCLWKVLRLPEIFTRGINGVIQNAVQGKAFPKTKALFASKSLLPNKMRLKK